MILYDRLGIEFAYIPRPGGFSLQVGKRDEDGCYRGERFAYGQVFNGRVYLVGEMDSEVFSFRELSRGYPHLGIPEFDSERELEMKLELMGNGEDVKPK